MSIIENLSFWLTFHKYEGRITCWFSWSAISKTRSCTLHPRSISRKTIYRVLCNLFSLSRYSGIRQITFLYHSCLSFGVWRDLQLQNVHLQFRGVVDDVMSTSCVREWSFTKWGGLEYLVGRHRKGGHIFFSKNAKKGAFDLSTMPPPLPESTNPYLFFWTANRLAS